MDEMNEPQVPASEVVGNYFCSITITDETTDRGKIENESEAPTERGIF